MQKNAIGRIPKLNEDLLDIKTNYLDKGQCFYLAIDEFDRVIGCIGTKTDENNNLTHPSPFIQKDLFKLFPKIETIECSFEYAVDKSSQKWYNNYQYICLLQAI